MPKYDLVGIDGNAFNIMAYTKNAMKHSGFKPDEIQSYLDIAKKKDYDWLLAKSFEMIEECNKRSACYDESDCDDESEE